MPLIKFVAEDAFTYKNVAKPYPAKESIPEWWKSMPAYGVSKNNLEGKFDLGPTRTTNATPKKCTPMLDSLLSGYIIPLWSDVFVRTKEVEDPQIFWRTNRDVFTEHGRVPVPAPVGYSEKVFKYMNKWNVVTPPGYSTLVIQPNGYLNTGMNAVSAIIDTDGDIHQLLPPLRIQNGFNGIIEKGTPVVQVIPFKRDDWDSEFVHLLDGEINDIHDATFGSTLVNHYVKNTWKKKHFK